MPSYTRYTASAANTGPRSLWLRVTKIAVLVVVCFVAVTAGMMVGFLQRTAAQVGKNDPQEVQQARPSLPRGRRASRSTSLFWAATGAPVSPPWEHVPTP